MLNSSLAALAIGFEVLGFSILLGYGVGNTQLTAYLSAHLAASVLAAALLALIMPGPSRSQPRLAFAFFLALCFFVPVLGVPGLLGAGILARLFRKDETREVFSVQAQPEYAPHEDPADAPHAHGPVRAQLSDPHSPVETRMRALLSIQDLPSRVANPVIREMLADPSDDVRLVAYGILDGREKRINARIQAARAQQEGADPTARLTADKELAELHWELVYQGLVQGDLQKHAAAQARVHFDAALKVAPDDAALWALGGRLAVFAGQYERAWHAFSRAVEFGMPEVRVLPYLAEVAFRMRRFDRVRQLLERIAQASHTQRMQQVIDYWNADVHAGA